MSRQVIDVRPYVGRQVAIEWCRSQYGIEPNDIPSESHIVIDHDARTLTYERIVRGPDGLPLFDGYSARVETVVKHFDEPIPEWP